jgi:hypothetical protein
VKSGADLTPTLLVRFIQQCITKTLDFGSWFLDFGVFRAWS